MLTYLEASTERCETTINGSQISISYILIGNLESTGLHISHLKNTHGIYKIMFDQTSSRVLMISILFEQ